MSDEELTVSDAFEDEFRAVSQEDGERLDHVLSSRYEENTRSYFHSLIKEGYVTVNDKSAKPGYGVKEGDLIHLIIPPPKDLDIVAEDIPLDILYEDKDLVIVNKPKGMVVHPSAGHYSGTLVNALLYHCGENLSGINGVLRPGIVHRIDKDTSGALVVCKNDRAHRFVAEQLKDHTITRKYRAIVYGRLTEDGTISTTIGRNPQHRKEMSVNVPGGKNAVTHYHVLENFEKYTYLECQLETGRTHQIRVHMKYIGHPVVGDEVYGPSHCPFKGVKGQILHAMTIGLIHPTTGEYIEVEAPLPEEFNNVLSILRNQAGS